MNIPVDAEAIKGVVELNRIQWPIQLSTYRKLGDELIELIYDFFLCDNSSVFSDI